jgi:hydroxymethylbilane synthase
VTDGELDGVVLACAGLARIGHAGAITQVFELDEMLPAPGQGALAVECRDGEPELAALLAAVNDPASMAAAVAERSLLEAFAAGCSAPVGGYAAGTEQLLMHAVVLSADGTRALRTHGTAPAAEARRLGADLAAELLRRGAAALVSSPMAPTNSGPDECYSEPAREDAPGGPVRAAGAPKVRREPPQESE